MIKRLAMTLWILAIQPFKISVNVVIIVWWMLAELGRDVVRDLKAVWRKQ